MQCSRLIVIVIGCLIYIASSSTSESQAAKSNGRQPCLLFRFRSVNHLLVLDFRLCQLSKAWNLLAALTNRCER